MPVGRRHAGDVVVHPAVEQPRREAAPAVAPQRAQLPLPGHLGVQRRVADVVVAVAEAAVGLQRHPQVALHVGRDAGLARQPELQLPVRGRRPGQHRDRVPLGVAAAAVGAVEARAQRAHRHRRRRAGGGGVAVRARRRAEVVDRARAGAGVLRAQAEFAAPAGRHGALPLGEGAVLADDRVAEVVDEERREVGIAHHRVVGAAAQVRAHAQRAGRRRALELQLAAPGFAADRGGATIRALERRQRRGAEVRRRAQVVVAHPVRGVLIVRLGAQAPGAERRAQAQVEQVGVVVADVHRQRRGAGVAGVVAGVVEAEFGVVAPAAGEAEAEVVALVLGAGDAAVAALHVVALVVHAVQVVAAAVVGQRQERAGVAAVVDRVSVQGRAGAEFVAGVRPVAAGVRDRLDVAADRRPDPHRGDAAVDLEAVDQRARQVVQRRIHPHRPGGVRLAAVDVRPHPVGVQAAVLGDAGERAVAVDRAARGGGDEGGRVRRVLGDGEVRQPVTVNGDDVSRQQRRYAQRQASDKAGAEAGEQRTGRAVRHERLMESLRRPCGAGRLILVHCRIGERNSGTRLGAGAGRRDGTVPYSGWTNILNTLDLFRVNPPCGFGRRAQGPPGRPLYFLSAWRGFRLVVQFQIPPPPCGFARRAQGPPGRPLHF